MKNKGIAIFASLVFATMIGFVAGDIKDTHPVEGGEVSMRVSEYLDLEEECEDKISFTFVETVIETDSKFGIKSNKETIVDELYGFFEKYGDDPYIILLCHHYGEEEAIKMTDDFTLNIQDEYVNTFYELEYSKIELPEM